MARSYDPSLWPLEDAIEKLKKELADQIEENLKTRRMIPTMVHIRKAVRDARKEEADRLEKLRDDAQRVLDMLARKSEQLLAQGVIVTREDINNAVAPAEESGGNESRSTAATADERGNARG